MSGPKVVGRRRFVSLVASASAGTVLLAACAPAAAPTAAPPAAAPTPQVVEKVVTQVVEKPVQVEVTKVVEKPVEITATPVPQVKGTLSIWSFPATEDDQNRVWKPLMTTFNKQYPQIEVKVDVLPWAGRREKMMTAYAAGAPPDIAYVNTDTLSQFGANDVLTDLTKLIPAETWADFPQNVTATGLSWKGKRIMVPNVLGMNGYVSNTDLLTQIGVDPKKKTFTWQDMLDMGAAAKPKGLFAWSWLLVSWDSWVTHVWQAGGNVYSDDATKSLLDQPAAEETLTFIAKLFQGGFVPKEGAVGSEQEENPSAVDYFVTGKQVISSNQEATFIDVLKNQAPKLKYGIIEPLKNKAQAYDSTAGCWGIFNKTKQLDPATFWVNFMIDPVNLGFYCSASGYTPPRKAAMDYWVVDPNMKAFVAATQPFAKLNQDCNFFWQEGKTTCAPLFQAAVLGKMQPKEALLQAHQKLQKIMDDFWAKQKA